MAQGKASEDTGAGEDRSRCIPAQVDEKVPILFWQPTEFIIAVSLLGIGIVMSLWTFGLVTAAVVLWGAKKLRRGAKPGAIQHLLWYLGLPLDKTLTRYFPSSSVREWLT